jgi:hypothetical protein
MKFFYRCDFNQYTINYILKIGELKSAKQAAIEITEKLDNESDTSMEEMDMS